MQRESCWCVWLSVNLGAMSEPCTGEAVSWRCASQNGSIRPLACGSVLRRIVAKAICRVQRDSLREAGGPRQYGISRAAGLETMHKSLSALAESHPRHVFMAFDAKNAFNSLSRCAVLRAFAGIPLGLMVSAMYGQPTQHLFWDDLGCGSRISAQRGVDQGCPLSPALFSAAIAPALQDLENRLL